MKRILVNGAGGFIGGHLVKRLKAEGFWVRAVDLGRTDLARRLRLTMDVIRTALDGFSPSSYD